MSKPAPIDWKLDYWNIEYGVGKFDVGIDGPDPADWHVQIIWVTDSPRVKDKRVDNGDFKTFKAAVAWLEENLGLQYNWEVI